jgi:hypothetical protein
MVTGIVNLMNAFAMPIVFVFFCTDVSQAETCRQTKAARQVIILPPTGGANAADRSLFKALCKRGHEVTLLDYAQPSGLTTDLEIHDRISREVLGEINRFLFENPKPTSLIGASLGGLYASMAYSYSLTKQTEFQSLKWIDSMVLTVAGGSLADVLSYSEQEGVLAQRELRFEKLNFESIEDYSAELERNIFYDPLKWATPAARANVLMFNSINDDVVPSFTQEALWQGWGEPEIERFSTNHPLSIARAYFLKVNRIDRFLNR